MKQNQGNKQKNIPSKPLRKIMIMIIAMVFVFTACHKKKKPFLLLPLIDNSSIASTDSGSGGPTFTPAIGMLDTSFNSPNGSIIQSISSFIDYGYSLVIQPDDGKILLGGHCHNGQQFRFLHCSL
jgi:Na+-transporting methylmalonyl-CoA/oxaloacetate decarboxylase beta subunit